MLNFVQGQVEEATAENWAKGFVFQGFFSWGTLNNKNQ
jgi:hypothetical protein